MPFDPPLMTLTAPVDIAFPFSKVGSYHIDIHLLRRVVAWEGIEG